MLLEVEGVAGLVPGAFVTVGWRLIVAIELASADEVATLAD